MLVIIYTLYLFSSFPPDDLTFFLFPYLLPLYVLKRYTVAYMANASIFMVSDYMLSLLTYLFTTLAVDVDAMKSNLKRSRSDALRPKTIDEASRP